MATITGKIAVERFDTSKNGNPRYICVIITEHGDSYTFYTGVDSMHAYGICNYGYDEVVRVELTYKRNKLTLNTIKKA